MEASLGRHLLPSERVHHTNGRRDDNRLENLELWHVKDPPGVRAADYHCFGCRCPRFDAAEGPGDLSPEGALVSSESATYGPMTPSTDGLGLDAPPSVPRGECAWCHRQFDPRTESQRCCSRSCARFYEGAYYFGGRGRGWRGGRVRHTNGYIWVYAPTHPRARSMPYVFEHVLVMERMLERELEPHERVHHRNGKRDDNRPENLELWRIKDPSGVRASDYHCPGCACEQGPVGMSEKLYIYRLGATLNSTWTTSPSFMT